MTYLFFIVVLFILTRVDEYLLLQSMYVYVHDKPAVMYILKKKEENSPRCKQS